MHYAHSTERPDKLDWEPLVTHLEAVAELAAAFARAFGAEKAARLQGLLHDLGKYSVDFQAYIAGSGDRGSVNHSTAGARAILALADSAPRDRLMADILAYGIAGHHAGLPDRSGGEAALSPRLDPSIVSIPPLPDIWRDQLTPDTANLFPPDLKLLTQDRWAFQLSVLGRMLFSCLVDADFLATERFYNARQGLEAERRWPRLADRIDGLIAAFDAHMVAKHADQEHVDIRRHALNHLRTEVLTHVRRQAALPKGVFTFDVPTGGGKTLASLAFALGHAKVHKHDRIIYAIPFTSIVEQTADIFTEVLGPDLVLEHHSALESDPPGEAPGAPAGAQQLAAKRRLAMENWGAPVIVTTGVQLFESLFAHRTARCRKLHNIANSIIILDEAQVLPLPLLRPCVAMLDELALNYGCTIVLCTATQPALLAPRANASGFKGGFDPETTRELAPDPVRLDTAFRRVTLKMRPGRLSDADLVAELAAQEKPPQGLVIVNSRNHALALYTTAKAAGLDGLVHLTTRQTAANRRLILADVRARLAAGAPCRVIATSLIEAGVDVSFPRAWRAMAGLDSVIQAAGRVNREWRWSKEESHIIVFTPADARPPQEIARAAEAMARVAARHEDLFAKAAIEAYFKEIYWQAGDGLDRIFVKNLDGQTIPKSVLTQFMAAAGRTDFAYRTVGEAFRFIEDGMASVIIPFAPDAEEVLDAMKHDLPAGTAARRLQNHVVQVPPRYRAKLIAHGHVAFIEGYGDDFAVLKTRSLYTLETGLLWEQAEQLGLDYIQ